MVDAPDLEDSPNGGKRKREEEELNLSNDKGSKRLQPSYTKHSKFWLLDGNILLQIETTRYKVQRSRLASQSTWFEKLFEQHSGKEAAEGDEDKENINDVLLTVECVDGLDLFHLNSTGVARDDFDALLTAMDDGICYYHDTPHFPVIASIFRVADRLQFKKYLEFAERVITEQFSDDVGDITVAEIPFAAEAVVLGRNWNIPKVLKRAFYELARMEHSLEEPAPEDEKESNDEDDPDEALEKLHPGDLVRLLKVSKYLGTAWHDTVFALTARCTQKPARCEHRSRLLLELRASVLPKYEFDPICGIQELIDRKSVV